MAGQLLISWAVTIAAVYAILLFTQRSDREAANRFDVRQVASDFVEIALRAERLQPHAVRARDCSDPVPGATTVAAGAPPPTVSAGPVNPGPPPPTNPLLAPERSGLTQKL